MNGEIVGMKYLNFDLEAVQYQKENGDERFRVRVANSPVDRQKLSEAEEVTLPSDLRQRLRFLEQRLLTLPEMIALGEEIGKALFPPRVRAILDASRRSLTGHERLRIRLMLDTYALADVPWEYAYIHDPNTPPDQKDRRGFLIFNRSISVVRHETLGQAPARLDPVGEGPLRLVALSAHPQGTPELKLDVEQENIRQALQEVSEIRPEFYPGATVGTLTEALVRSAHIFHFSGHGKFEGEMGEAYGTQEGQGSLLFMGADGQEAPFSAEKLALNLAGRGVRLAVLGACESGKVDQVNAWTGIAPALTWAGIPAVVGMQFKVRDTNAIAFSKIFYRSLADGQSIDEAVTAGRLAIFNEGNDDERDWGVPVLYLRAEEGVLFPKPQRSDINPPAATGPNPRHVTPPAGAGENVNQKALREAMVRSFEIEDLKVLCADVQAALEEDRKQLVSVHRLIW